MKYQWTVALRHVYIGRGVALGDDGEHVITVTATDSLGSETTGDDVI